MASRGRGCQRRLGLWGIDQRLWSWKFERDSSSVLLENKRAEANFSKTAVIQSGGNMEHVTEDVPKLELGGFPASSSRLFISWTARCSWGLGDPRCTLSFYVFGGMLGAREPWKWLLRWSPSLPSRLPCESRAEEEPQHWCAVFGILFFNRERKRFAGSWSFSFSF